MCVCTYVCMFAYTYVYVIIKKEKTMNLKERRKWRKEMDGEK